MWRYPAAFARDKPADLFVITDDFVSSGGVSGEKCIPFSRLKIGSVDMSGGQAVAGKLISRAVSARTGLPSQHPLTSPCPGASEQLKSLRGENEDQKTGIEIVRKVFSAPASQIATNAGEDGSVMVGKMHKRTITPTASARRPPTTATWSQRHHRPDQGGARRDSERGFGRGAVDHHRSDGRSLERDTRSLAQQRADPTGGVVNFDLEPRIHQL